MPAPLNVLGEPRVGGELLAAADVRSVRALTGNPEDTRVIARFSWHRSTAEIRAGASRAPHPDDTAAWTLIPGAMRPAYRCTEDDAGRWLRVTVVPLAASSSGGRGSGNLDTQLLGGGQGSNRPMLRAVAGPILGPRSLAGGELALQQSQPSRLVMVEGQYTAVAEGGNRLTVHLNPSNVLADEGERQAQAAQLQLPPGPQPALGSSSGRLSVPQPDHPTASGPPAAAPARPYASLPPERQLDGRLAYQARPFMLSEQKMQNHDHHSPQQSGHPVAILSPCATSLPRAISLPRAVAPQVLPQQPTQLHTTASAEQYAQQQQQQQQYIVRSLPARSLYSDFYRAGSQPLPEQTVARLVAFDATADGRSSGPGPPGQGAQRPEAASVSEAALPYECLQPVSGPVPSEPHASALSRGRPDGLIVQQNPTSGKSPLEELQQWSAAVAAQAQQLRYSPRSGGAMGAAAVGPVPSLPQPPRDDGYEHLLRLAEASSMGSGPAHSGLDGRDTPFAEAKAAANAVIGMEGPLSVPQRPVVQTHGNDGTGVVAGERPQLRDFAYEPQPGVMRYENPALPTSSDPQRPLINGRSEPVGVTQDQPRWRSFLSQSHLGQLDPQRGTKAGPVHSAGHGHAAQSEGATMVAAWNAAEAAFAREPPLGQEQPQSRNFSIQPHPELMGSQLGSQPAPTTIMERESYTARYSNATVLAPPSIRERQQAQSQGDAAGATTKPPQWHGFTSQPHPEPEARSSLQGRGRHHSHLSAAMNTLPPSPFSEHDSYARAAAQEGRASSPRLPQSQNFSIQPHPDPIGSQLGSQPAPPTVVEREPYAARYSNTTAVAPPSVRERQPAQSQGDAAGATTKPPQWHGFTSQPHPEPDARAAAQEGRASSPPPPHRVDRTLQSTRPSGHRGGSSGGGSGIIDDETELPSPRSRASRQQPERAQRETSVAPNHGPELRASAVAATSRSGVSLREALEQLLAQHQEVMQQVELRFTVAPQTTGAPAAPALPDRHSAPAGPQPELPDANGGAAAEMRPYQSDAEVLPHHALGRQPSPPPPSQQEEPPLQVQQSTGALYSRGSGTSSLSLSNSFGIGLAASGDIGGRADAKGSRRHAVGGVMSNVEEDEEEEGEQEEEQEEPVQPSSRSRGRPPTAPAAGNGRYRPPVQSGGGRSKRRGSSRVVGNGDLGGAFMSRLFQQMESMESESDDVGEGAAAVGTNLTLGSSSGGASSSSSAHLLSSLATQMETARRGQNCYRGWVPDPVAMLAALSSGMPPDFATADKWVQYPSVKSDAAAGEDGNVLPGGEGGGAAVCACCGGGGSSGGACRCGSGRQLLKEAAPQPLAAALVAPPTASSSASSSLHDMRLVNEALLRQLAESTRLQMQMQKALDAAMEQLVSVRANEPQQQRREVSTTPRKSPLSLHRQPSLAAKTSRPRQTSPGREASPLPLRTLSPSCQRLASSTSAPVGAAAINVAVSREGGTLPSANPIAAPARVRSKQRAAGRESRGADEGMQPLAGGSPGPVEQAASDGLRHGSPAATKANRRVAEALQRSSTSALRYGGAAAGGRGATSDADQGPFATGGDSDGARIGGVGPGGGTSATDADAATAAALRATLHQHHLRWRARKAKLKEQAQAWQYTAWRYATAWKKARAMLQAMVAAQGCAAVGATAEAHHENTAQYHLGQQPPRPSYGEPMPRDLKPLMSQPMEQPKGPTTGRASELRRQLSEPDVVAGIAAALQRRDPMNGYPPHDRANPTSPVILGKGAADLTRVARGVPGGRATRVNASPLQARLRRHRGQAGAGTGAPVEDEYGHEVAEGLRGGYRSSSLRHAALDAPAKNTGIWETLRTAAPADMCS